jgi:hypothetical protein
MLTHGLPCPMTEKSTNPFPLLLSGQRQTRLCGRIIELSLVMLALTDPTRSYDNVKHIGWELIGSFRVDFVCPARLEVKALTSQNFGVTQNRLIKSFMLCMHTCLSPFDF